MSNQNPTSEPNRSSAPTPEQLGVANSQATKDVNALVASAVDAAIKGAFAQLGPLLESLSMTPEKIRAANTPYKDPAVIARELREMTIWKEDMAENERKKREHQDNCPHQYETGTPSIGIIRNYPDRQPRGICVTCHAYIHPREWRIGAPDAKHPRGVPYLVEPHKSYKTVMVLAAKS